MNKFQSKPLNKRQIPHPINPTTKFQVEPTLSPQPWPNKKKRTDVQVGCQSQKRKLRCVVPELPGHHILPCKFLHYRVLGAMRTLLLVVVWLRLLLLLDGGWLLLLLILDGVWLLLLDEEWLRSSKLKVGSSELTVQSCKCKVASSKLQVQS